MSQPTSSSGQACWIRFAAVRRMAVAGTLTLAGVSLATPASAYTVSAVVVHANPSTYGGTEVINSPNFTLNALIAPVHAIASRSATDGLGGTVTSAATMDFEFTQSSTSFSLSGSATGTVDLNNVSGGGLGGLVLMNASIYFAPGPNEFLTQKVTGQFFHDTQTNPAVEFLQLKRTDENGTDVIWERLNQGQELVDESLDLQPDATYELAWFEYVSPEYADPNGTYSDGISNLVVSYVPTYPVPEPSSATLLLAAIPFVAPRRKRG
jgi:hypothetical protein